MIARVLFAWLLLCGVAFAQPATIPGWPPLTNTVAATYQGPVDIVASPTGFWSCARAESAAYANGTNPLCDLKDKTTGTVAICTLRVKTTGFVDLTGSYCAGSTTPAAACAAAAGGSCVVSQAYDQSGNSNHMAQATAARMPALTFSALGGLPGMTFVGATPQFLTTAGNITNAAPYSISGVMERTGSFTTVSPLLGSSTSSELLGFSNTSNTAIVGDAGATFFTATGATDSTFIALQGTITTTGALSGLMVNGTDNIGTASNTTMAGALRINRYGGATSSDGVIMEAGLWPSAFSSGNRTSINANQHSAANGYNF